MNKIDYKSAGVDIDAANEAVDRIKRSITSTFTSAVLSDVGSFGAMLDLRETLKNYDNPILVQSIDGVGTKMIIARMMNNFSTIGIDLVSATCNDIIVHGARPLTFLDYIANDKLRPEIIESIVNGIAEACRDTGVALIGGETAEMPDTYLPREHDLVGVVSGVVEKDKTIIGDSILPGDRILGLASSGLHTNGYSLARKLFFDVGKFNVYDGHPDLNKSVGETLLEPHINYTNPILSLIDAGAEIKGMAHITGGGLLENIPRILPDGCSAEIRKGSWPILPVFNIMQNLGHLDEREMYRTFNMGIGMVMIVSPPMVTFLKENLEIPIFQIGGILQGNKGVEIT